MFDRHDCVFYSTYHSRHICVCQERKRNYDVCRTPSSTEKAKGLKQTELAKIIGIGWRGYQTYERGEREPTLSTLIALADFYGLSLDELVCRER